MVLSEGANRGWWNNSRLPPEQAVAAHRELNSAGYSFFCESGMPLLALSLESLRNIALEYSAGGGRMPSQVSNSVLINNEGEQIPQASVIEARFDLLGFRAEHAPEAFALLLSGSYGIPNARGEARASVRQHFVSSAAAMPAGHALYARKGCTCHGCMVVRYLAVTQGLLAVDGVSGKFVPPGTYSAICYIVGQRLHAFNGVMLNGQLSEHSEGHGWTDILYHADNADAIRVNSPGECTADAFVNEWTIINFLNRIGSTEYTLSREAWWNSVMERFGGRASRVASNTVRRSIENINEDGLTIRQFGVEIECLVPGVEEEARSLASRVMRRLGLDSRTENYNHSTRPYWKVTTDASVGVSIMRGSAIVADSSRPYTGAEVVSPILHETSEVTQMLRALARAGAKVNRSCGLHVHVDAHDFELAHWKRLFKLYSRYEPAIDSFMPKSRRGNNNPYCMSLKTVVPNGITGFWDKLETVGSLEQLKRLFPNRYFKVNIQSFWAHGTCEFRQHSGTLNSGKVARWVRLLDAIVAYAVSDLPLPSCGEVVEIEAMFRELGECRGRLIERRGLRVPTERPSSRDIRSAVRDRAWAALMSVRGTNINELLERIEAINWTETEASEEIVVRTRDEFLRAVHPQLVDALMDLSCFFSERAQELAEA